MSLKVGQELNVIAAKWVTHLVLEISFSDGETKQVDFEPFIAASSQPEVRAYLDVERFKGFEISYGNLVWNDYDLCFSIEDLYTGRLLAGETQLGRVAEDGPGYGRAE